MKKLTNQPPAVKIRRSTLESIGFMPGERTVVIKSARLDRIGKTFLRLGLVSDPVQWWMKSVRFECNGLLHEFEVTGCNGDFRVRLYQEKSKFHEWLHKRPEGHPERTRQIELGLTDAELREGFKYCQRHGIESFEDLMHLAIRKGIELEKEAAHV